jgi:hypothetical protein
LLAATAQFTHNVAHSKKQKALQIIAGLFYFIGCALTLFGIDTKCTATRIGQQ